MPKTMHDLLIDALRDAYSAEQQLLAALPHLAKAAGEGTLAQHFDRHVVRTQDHVGRLCAIFDDLGVAPEGKVSLPMEGFLTEMQKLAAEGLPPDLLDAALVAAAHKIAHYEMAAYGSLCGYADVLGKDGHAKSLRASLAEEKDFDAGLSELARAKINPRAA